mgnify:CR=1 FL=1
MPVLHDYYCDIHGIFESFEAKCPMKNCKGELSKVFLKPVGLKSDKTKKTDKTLTNLALDFGMTDIKSTREGEHQSGYFKRNNELSDKQFAEATQAMQANQQAPSRPGDAAMWGSAGGINMKSVMGGRYKPVADENVSFNPKAAGNLTGPKAGVIINDHENLQVKQS